MTTIGNESRPAYVYDADTDTWVPIGFGPHTHDEYIDKTIITTKGDIIVGTATEAVERLGVGAEGSVLIADPTSPTGLAWGEAGGSITVSTTAPEEPGEGDLWFNSTNATTYIYYDGFWVEQSPAIAGPKGEPGIVASASEPSDTDVIWLDTDEEPDVPVPAGGTTGQVLIKSSSDDYDTDWVNPPSGNAIINGAFDIWQRGTSFTTGSTGQLVFSADRWILYNYGTNTGSCTQQTFTLGAAPVAGYEGSFFARFNSTSTLNFFQHRVEDVRTFAGQTATLSFFAKSASAQTLTVNVVQQFGSGGSSQVVITNTVALTTSWARHTITVSLASIAGKTIGTSSALTLEFAGAANNAIDIWGVQLEAGAVATPFKRNAPSIQAELAACQRYYVRHSIGTSPGAYLPGGVAVAITGTVLDIHVPHKVSMRSGVSSVETGLLGFYNWRTNGSISGGTIALYSGSTEASTIRYTHGSSVFNVNDNLSLVGTGNGTLFIGLSAEL
jgi:hypothetical protein